MIRHNFGCGTIKIFFLMKAGRFDLVVCLISLSLSCFLLLSVACSINTCVVLYLLSLLSLSLSLPPSRSCLFPLLMVLTLFSFRVGKNIRKFEVSIILAKLIWPKIDLYLFGKKSVKNTISHSVNPFACDPSILPGYEIALPFI